MDISILDHSFTRIYIIDTYKSFIWNDRYNEYGDFEIYVSMSNDVLTKFQNGYYVQANMSDRTMIIENLTVTTDIEEGDFLCVTGRSLESILDRRIVWQQTTFYKPKKVISVIEDLIKDSITEPTIENRKISNFVFDTEASEIVSDIGLTSDMQFTGDVIYDAIVKICDLYDIGFKILLEDGKFNFYLFKTTDHTYNQSTASYVVFSPDMDNLISSEYNISSSNYKNVTLVAGEGEGSARKTATINNDTYSGLDRRELFTDARDLSSENGEITDDQYKEILESRGLAKLNETTIDTSFDANVDYMQPFAYGEAYHIGDIVQFINQYGIAYRVRVSEFIYSDSSEGTSAYPKFTILEEV